MSFGFGGFGSNNNNQTQSTGFGGGGFGSPANTNTGFGASTNTGFGSNTANTGGGLFGSNNNSGGFGSSTGGFGSTANNNTGFGAPKPAFGSPANTGNSLFGGGTNNANASSGTGFGGFGSTTNNQSGGFGSSTTGGGLFGANQNKPAFGASTTGTSGGGLFGGGNTTSNTFGQSTGGFGSTGGGFGQQNQAVNQGTGSTPFSAYQEKDTAANSTSHFQSISFMQPYQNFSFEELRLADYAAGRKYGNSNGQAGAFGQSTGFGGFGQNNTTATTNTGFGSNNTTNNTGGLFGNNNNANQSTSLFGQNQQNNTSTGFGSTTGGGLFGQQNKPAGSGLFGGSNTTSTNTGGLFGANNNTQNNQNTGGFGGFGQNNNASNNTGGGLFGNNQQNQTQNKPFGGFGTTNNTTGGFGSSTGGFGQQNTQTTGTGLFGNANNNTSGGGLFGNNQQTQQNTQATSAFGGFGQNNQTQQTNTTGGMFGGGGGFGQNNSDQNQQKPGGLFGNTNSTGGGLFGNNNQQQNTSTGTGLFGNAQNQQQSSGIFGSKPATGGTGLFGNANNTNTMGSGLFGNTNQQQNQPQGSGLFGQANNQQQKPGGIFGSTGTTGSGLFGNAQNTNTTGSTLFGQQQNVGGSFFGNSQQNQQQNQPQSLTASLTQNPYGNDQLFAGLGLPTPSVGPLATPLSGAQKPAKRPQMVSPFKVNPSASMRLLTPQRRPNGYGFSYSTYGTPGSAQSLTPGRISLFGSGGPQKSLSKSLSTSNLRTTLNAEDSVLAPGAFTPNYRPYSSGNSIRRLKIDRTLRNDLFGEATPERSDRRVTFDGSGLKNGSIPENQTNGSPSPGPNNALVRTESGGTEPSTNGTTSHVSKPAQRPNGVSSRPEMEQVRGNELAVVPEGEEMTTSAPSTVKTVRNSTADPTPGDYYMIPSIQDIRDMSREQLKNVSPFIVGRVKVGKIEFSKVDLTDVPLDRIFDDIVKLHVRQATVYSDNASPPEGKGLNVPSTITLENSWPRGRSHIDKHLERLKRVDSTEFVDYVKEKGEWIFRVQHFTTYGLDDDDEDDESMLDPNDVAPTFNDSTAKVPSAQIAAEPIPALAGSVSLAESDIEDTFSFKKPARHLPGSFGGPAAHSDDVEEEVDIAHEDEVGHVVEEAATYNDLFEPGSSMQDGHSMDADMEGDDQLAIGAFPPPEITAPKSILKGRLLSGTPVKAAFRPNDDWAEQLLRTVSPKKQDRRALREQQNDVLDNRMSPTKPNFGRPIATTGFSTTMDIMDSLWNQPKSQASKPRGGKGFEWPYEKSANGTASPSSHAGDDQASHVKPRWSGDGTLSYAVAGNVMPLKDGILVNTKASLVGEGKDVRFANVQAPLDTHNAALTRQLGSDTTKFLVGKDGIPFAQIGPQPVSFLQILDSIGEDADTTERERGLWRLAAILFDPVQNACRQHAQGIPEADLSSYEHAIRRDAVLDFWRELTKSKAMGAFRDAPNLEEKALACLSCGDVESACTTLVDGRNFHLATLISQLQSVSRAKEVMKKQIQAWGAQHVISEVPPVLRALYELIAGNAAISEGESGPQENRAPSFGIAEQFGLDWQQSLGLRLWYAEEDIEHAVQSYLQDIDLAKESTLPVVKSEGEKDFTQDGLMVLLRLYAALTNPASASSNLGDLLSPIAMTGNPFNARLSWQLVMLLNARSLISSSASTLDNLTTSLAAQLESLGTVDGILTACTVLLHLSTADVRAAAIKSLLSRRAALLTTGVAPFAIEAGQDATLQHLLAHHIPGAWLHAARALHAAATGDHVAQAAYLVLAGERDEAHAVLCSNVGPAAVISRDFDHLRELLGHFLPASGAAPRDISAWSSGGQVFFDYVHLLDLAGPRGNEARKREVLERLVAALPAAKAAAGDAGLERKVALAEISRVVLAETRGLGAAAEEGLAMEKLAKLPLPHESFARQGARLWDLYGRALKVS